MTSAQMDIKRSLKFNYLLQEENKEKLAKYDKLDFSPKIYKRNYDQTVKNISLEKQKENHSQNLPKCIKSNAKGYNSISQLSNSSQKHGQISFGKNRNLDKLNQLEKKEQNHHVQKKDQRNIKFDQDEYEQQPPQNRAKSIGSIGLKKPLFEPKDIQEKVLIEFSPYQEELKFSFKDIERDRSRSEFESYVQGIDNHGQNLLIYELQEQQLIVRKQLKEYQYQNELLKQRIQFLEKENIHLKHLGEQNSKELKEKDIFYQRKINSLNVDIKELEEQAQIWKLYNQQLFFEISNQKKMISQLQEELNLLSARNNELQILLTSKDAIIVELNTQIQLHRINELNQIEIQQNKRRKSMDLSTQAQRFLQQQRSINNQNIEKQPSQLSKTFHVGKLMKTKPNQTTNLRSQSRLHYRSSQATNSIQHSSISPSKNLTIEKYVNLIESMKSMYSKVTGQESRDLKELWKWLKMITHEYQSFVVFYEMKDQILAVLDDMENRLDTSKLEDELSFMDKECYKILKKLAHIVAKQQ